jgi:membrane-bound acyltransferase YfiQ involved in biofilm formation
MYCGNVSYELFLIHGAILIKYNFIFPLFANTSIVIAFAMLILVLLAISKGFHTLLRGDYILYLTNRKTYS